MKNLERNAISNDKEKLTEKTFTQSIALSVFTILFCLIALCSVTWAWFNDSTSLTTSGIRSAECNVSIVVSNDDTLVESVDGKYSFEKDKAYKIKLTAIGTANWAYCTLNIDNVNYYTEQIPVKTTETPLNSITFTLQFSESINNIEIKSHWGISSQVKRDFADGLFYLDLVVTDASTIISE